MPVQWYQIKDRKCLTAFIENLQHTWWCVTLLPAQAPRLCWAIKCPRRTDYMIPSYTNSIHPKPSSFWVNHKVSIVNVSVLVWYMCDSGEIANRKEKFTSQWHWHTPQLILNFFIVNCSFRFVWDKFAPVTYEGKLFTITYFRVHFVVWTLSAQTYLFMQPLELPSMQHFFLEEPAIMRFTVFL